MIKFHTYDNFPNIYKTNKLCFKGNFPNEASHNNAYLLALDLDGTFAEGVQENFDSFLKLKDTNNCKLAFVTGRTMMRYKKLVREMGEKGIKMPEPDFVILNNGQELYDNIDGKLCPNEKWNSYLFNMGFNKAEVQDKIAEIVQQIPEAEGVVIPIKSFSSPYNLEYVIGSERQKEILNAITEKIENNGINHKFYTLDLPPDIVKIVYHQQDSETQEKLAKIVDKKGHLRYLNIGLFDKASAVRFVQKELNIDPDHVITAGNDENDKSLADSEFWFILVQNATQVIKEHALKVLNRLKGSCKIIFSNNCGTKGVNEGLSQIFNVIESREEILD